MDMATMKISLLLLAFPLLFPLLWVGISVLTGRLSGWARLAEFYRYSGVFKGHQWKRRTAFLRFGMGVKSGLHLGVSHEGLHLAVMALFRIGHQPLLVPWHDISTSMKTQLGVRYTELRFQKCPTIPFSIRTSLAEEIMRSQGDLG